MGEYAAGGFDTADISVRRGIISSHVGFTGSPSKAMLVVTLRARGAGREWPRSTTTVPRNPAGSAARNMCCWGDGGETSRQPRVHPEPGHHQEQGKPVGRVQPGTPSRPLEPDQQPDHRRQNQTIDADLGLRLPCQVVPQWLQRPPNTRTQVSQRRGAHRSCPVGSGLDPTRP